MIYMTTMLFYLSICGFFLNYYYYLKSLMMIEFIMISVMVVLSTGIYGICHYMIYILILSVCEGVIGLLLLILLYRLWGSDSYMLVDYNL